MSHLSFADLSARNFLILYLCALVVLPIVIGVVKLRVKRSWANGLRKDENASDDELALMAGGWARVVELNVLRLLYNGSVCFKKGWFGSSFLVYKGVEGQSLSCENVGLLAELKKYGKRGMPMAKLQAWIESSSFHIEENLAVRGLRALNSEAKALRRKLLLAPWIFFLIGAVRLGQGIYRGENILYLLITVFVGILALSIFSMVNPVTREGKKLLNSRRKVSRNAISGGVTEAYTAYATLGWLGIAGTTFAADLGDDVAQYFQQGGHSTAFDGGASSGGSDGGDGGCGGCGGCG